MGSRAGTSWRGLAVVLALSLVAAACGDTDDTADSAATAVDDEVVDTETAADTDPAEDEAPAAGDPTDDETEAPAAGDGDPDDGRIGSCGEPDTSIDAEEGEGAGEFLAALDCAASNPLQAEGEPLTVGVQNHEGDPAGSFPEYSQAIEAAADYINTELGGLGADLANGVPGRPIEIEVCAMPVNPADSQRCANELASGDPFVVLSTINFFGNHFPVYEAAGVPVIVGTPITVADFTSPAAFSIGAGGGCLGVHTGMVELAANDLGGRRIAVPWSDNAPGAVCFYDLESKPLDVLAGLVDSDSERAGSMPDLEHIGVPIVPATPDITPQVSEVLGYEPDVIMYSAQGADCWNFVETMGRLGWSAEDTPLVLSGACVDFEAMEQAGSLAEGIYFIGASGNQLTSLDAIEKERQLIEATNYQTKAREYGLPESELRKGFATQGWNATMAIWEMSAEVTRGGGELTQDALTEAFASTEDHHLYNSTPISCATAPEPYIAVCNSVVSATQWDGESLVPFRQNFTGIDLLEGTELRTGPS